MSNKMWKVFENQIAKWFSTKRNIGSGRINSTDSGKPRPGDIVLPEDLKTLVECKTRQAFPKTGTYPRVLDTLNEAKKEKKKHFFHFERKNGSKAIYLLGTNELWMGKICNFIREELERMAHGNNN